MGYERKEKVYTFQERPREGRGQTTPLVKANPLQVHDKLEGKGFKKGSEIKIEGKGGWSCGRAHRNDNEIPAWLAF